MADRIEIFTAPIPECHSRMKYRWAMNHYECIGLDGEGGCGNTATDESLTWTHLGPGEFTPTIPDHP